MSREEFKNFLNAAERTPSLRRKLKDCHDSKTIIEVASSYGFAITAEDLTEDKKAENIENWFKNSKISPLKLTSTEIEYF